MDSTGALKSSSTGGGLASKVRNIKGNLRMPIRNVTFTKPLNDKVAVGHEVSLDDIPHVTKEKDLIQMKEKLSYASVVYEKPSKKVVKIKEMRNEISVHGAAVTIPIDAVKAVSARFVNTLYGYFIGNRLAFPLVENYTPNTILKKNEIKHVPVWVKMHHVPIVAYSDIGLSLISTQIGKPLMLDCYMSNMCMHSWGRSTYTRVLIEISTDVDLMDSLVIAIPHCDREGHTFATIEIEYEWTPPRCASCKFFDHVSDKCPKLPKEVSNVKITDDGFTEVKKKKAKGKKKHKKQVEGVRLTKPALNLQYRRVDKGETSKQKVISKENVKSVKNAKDESKTWDEDNGRLYGDVDQVVNDSDSEDVDEYITMEKGTRIIVGWNHDDVDVSVIHQDPQVIHTRVWIKADRKEFFCSFVYAHNYYIHSPSSLDITMREFKECVETMEVMDVQRIGLHFTWNQKPKGKYGILRKLDRVLANLEFQDRFMGAHAMFKSYRIFDHSPSVLSIPSLVMVKPKPFKVFNVAILDKRFKDVVREEWSYNVSGFDMFRVVKKLKGLKKPIRKMMYDKGNLYANVIRLRENLDRLQAALDNDPSNVSVREEEAVVVVAFNEAILLEEKFLKQKAKITWLREGDANTAYFHKMVRSHVSHSRIDVVTDINGAVFQNDDVAKAFINHYEALDMVRVVSSQEVKSAMLSMGNDKSPGPDGFTATFFKDTWNIIGSDVTKAIFEFFTNGRLLKELNHTILALIPKLNAPARVNDYRPISCCNKAYDTVDLEFLRAALFRFGFHDRMIAWIMECVSTTSFSISINVSLHGFFKGKRGLRQGDPLSPYLFTLVMEVFILMLHRRVSESSNFTYHRYYLELELINLCFADDLFLFAHGDVYSASIIKEALDEFRDAPGLNPSMPKSKAYFCNVLNHTKLAILYVLPFEEDCLSVKYLGSISSGKAKVAWEVVCLPKKEGGLGIRRLDQFNKALMVSHIWKLLSFKESLWVKWIHVYKLKNRSFWDILYRGGVLQALCVTSFQLVTLLGLALALHRRFVSAFMVVCGVGRMIGCDGSFDTFSVQRVWETIRPRDNEVPWYDLVWFSSCIPRHAVHILNRTITSICSLIVHFLIRFGVVLSIMQLTLAVVAYFVWQERNLRLFKGSKRSIKEVVDCVISFVRLKLLSCRFKKSKDAVLFSRLWELPLSILK
uniref:Reverse transcriptase domain-containing protein n=1 Tax=Tanacetum cinerariifolium TaxID=118510 RepID=A0A6L2LXH1_TANCI|nr:hypothetical protein [Tanacetum cinerariifolium]